MLCNILPPTLTHLLPELALEPGGLLFLAGINAANEEAPLAVLQSLGLEELAEQTERGWIARVWRKQDRV